MSINFLIKNPLISFGFWLFNTKFHRITGVPKLNCPIRNRLQRNHKRIEFFHSKTAHWLDILFITILELYSPDMSFNFSMMYAPICHCFKLALLPRKFYCFINSTQFKLLSNYINFLLLSYEK